jgi:hypothetical protein
MEIRLIRTPFDEGGLQIQEMLESSGIEFKVILVDLLHSNENPTIVLIDYRMRLEGHFKCRNFCDHYCPLPAWT